MSLHAPTSPAALLALPLRAFGKCLMGGVCAGLLLAGAALAQSVKPGTAYPVAAVGARQAPVKVEAAWLRPAVQGQMGTGGFMQLTAPTDLKLVGLSSPMAGQAQVHEMAMVGDVMQMREAGPLMLPAGQMVALQPGPGHRHLMLMGLKGPLKVGDQVKLVLKFQRPDGKVIKQTVMVPVAALAPAASSPAPAALPASGMAH
jgi:copper(I)-binding protein